MSLFLCPIDHGVSKNLCDIIFIQLQSLAVCSIFCNTQQLFHSIAAKCLRTLSGLFSPNLIDQSSRRTGLVLASVVRIQHDDWPIRLGENRPDRVLKHLADMFYFAALRELMYIYI